AGKGDGTFWQAGALDVPTLSKVRAYDFDEDGHLDLIGIDDSGLGRPPNSVPLLMGLGDGSFRSLSGASQVRGGPGVADFNPGGARGKDEVLLGAGDGPFSSVPFELGGDAQAITAADVNRDGRPDVIAVPLGPYPTTLLVAAGNGDGTFQPPLSYDLFGDGEI